MLRGSVPVSKHLSTEENLFPAAGLYAGVPTNEADLLDRHDHPVGQSKVVCYHTYLQSLVLFVEQTQKPRYESG